MCTYSTCFDHSGGSLKVMNIQLVKIVHIMIMLKRVRSQLRKIWKTESIILQYTIINIPNLIKLTEYKDALKMYGAEALKSVSTVK